MYINQQTLIEYSHGTIIFRSNVAYNNGGAIYITQPSNDVCPFSSPSKFVSKQLIFQENFAISGGNDLFGGSIDQ